MGCSRLIKSCCFMLAMLMSCTPGANLRAQPPVIAIISSSDAGPYRQVIQQFQASLQQARQGIEFVHIKTDDDGNKLSQLRKAPPALVFTLGPDALRLANTQLPGSPLLASMILAREFTSDTVDTAAITLDMPASEQLQWHKRLLPEARRVGVLYSPKDNQAWVSIAARAAAAQGLELIPVGVDSPGEIASALKSLGQRADSILGIPDKTVYSSSTAKTILLYSFRNRIPFVGLSGAWVKAGALYALDWDYENMGRQSADIALSILDGAKPGPNTLHAPVTNVYQLNLKTAKHLKLEFSPELIEGADKIYE